MASISSLPILPIFEEAVSSHERELMRYLLRTTGDREDALDLFQETWLRAYRAYPALKAGTALRPWLYRIAINLCRNRARDRTRRARVMVSDGHELAERAAVTGSNDGAIAIGSAIKALPPNQRRSLIMRKFDGLSYGEIGASLKCSPESARAHVYQALKKLKTVAE
ncbi:MAG TPA: RNA polymerase sigma factor [Candidatus Binataceae bacterium]|nr:RNA polymerase sigma factor [Candidatus Binataceae bacterium]